MTTLILPSGSTSYARVRQTLRGMGTNQFQPAVAPLTKQERWALRDHDRPEVSHSVTTLDGPLRRRLNHPNGIITRYKAAHREHIAPAAPSREKSRPPATTVEPEQTALTKGEQSKLEAYKRNSTATSKARARVMIFTFNYRVADAAEKRAEEYFVSQMLKELKEARALKNWSSAQWIMTREQHKKIMQCVHPDNPASTARTK